MDTVETETPSLPSCEARCMRMSPAGLCAWCYRRLRRDLAELAELYRRVAADLMPGSGGGEKVSGSREDPVPVRLAALSWIGPAAPGEVRDVHRDQTGPVPLIAVLTEWTRLVVEETGFRPMRQEIVHLLWWLDLRAEWCAAQRDWADDYAAEVHDQVLIGRGLAGGRIDDVRPERVRVPCPRCDRRTVWRRPGEDRVECAENSGGCGILWTEDEWTAEMEAVAA